MSLAEKLGELFNSPSLPEDRGYLGASSIGEECERKLFYSFRAFGNKQLSARLKRIFSLGNAIEDEVVNLLKSHFTIISSQKGFKDLGNHYAGHSDGEIFIDGELYVLEVKSAKKSEFNKAVKGYKQWNYKYWCQIQEYLRTHKADKALVVVYCKDDSELYFEEIKKEETQLLQKAERIIFAEEVPARAFHARTFYKCKFCDYSDICWNNERPREHCKTCCHSTPLRSGGWVCDKERGFGTVCDEYTPIMGE